MSLPEEYSHDISRESLPGKGTKVLLQKGDMLYLPRGTIHEAVSQSQFSTHVTISVYQHYNMKKLLTNLIPRLLDSAFHKNINLREGLPIWMSDKFGSYVGLKEKYLNSNQNSNDKNESNHDSKSIENQSINFQHSEIRKKMVENLKSLVQSLVEEISIEILDETADEITGDFVMHRLPPPDAGADDDDDDSNIDNNLTHMNMSNDDNDDSMNDSNYKTTSNVNNMRTNARNNKNNCNNDSSRHTNANQISSCKLYPESLIKICDPRSMFCMVKEEDGISMLALSHNKYNDRAAHMGHPSSDLGYDSNSESDSDSEGRCLENNAVGDGDRDKEEIENGSGSERNEDEDGGEEDEGFIWALYIPQRLAAVIIGLQLACSSDENIVKDHFTSISISLQCFQKMMEKKRIFPDEVIIFFFGSTFSSISKYFFV